MSEQDTRELRNCGTTEDNASQVPESDTREKLEDDIYRAADEMDKLTHGERFINTHKILRWLDRQAAITRRECAEKCDGQNKHETVRQDELSDTRDQLEVDMIKLCHMDMLQARPFLELLDRQAAITEREQTDKWQHLAYGNGLLEADKMALQDSVAELTAERQIAELTAERDQLSRDLDAEHTLCLQFEEDNERLKKANRIQAESFRKLEVELTKMKDADDE